MCHLRSAAIFLFALCLGLSHPAHAQQVLDGIAAVVNGEVITFSQVRDVTALQERSMRQTYMGKELVDKIQQLRKQALKELIDRALIIQDFKKNKFSIPEYVVDDQIKSIIQREFGGSRAAFLRTLKAQHYSFAQLRKDQMDKVIVQAMRQKNTGGKTTFISPKKVHAYYEKHLADYTSKAQIELRMIVLKKGDNPDAKKKMAEEIRTKIQKGAQFDKMARVYSEDDTRDFGGDWGWVDRKTLNKKLTDAAFRLKAGKVSPVVSDGGNYYLLYVDKRKPSVTKSFKSVRADIEKTLQQIERKKDSEKWVDRLRAKAYVKIY